MAQVDLSDGTTIKATADHPFWGESGPGIAKHGWFLAEQLLPGDQLRTASGPDATVVRLRYHGGQAVAYTLTVANDHTYFVGADRVLVHNYYVHTVTESELLQEGVHITADGVELSVRPGYGGTIVFTRVFSYNSDAEIEAAIKEAQEELKTSKTFLNQLYGAAQRALQQAQTSGNPKIRARTAEYAFLIKDLRKLGAQ
jgi:hypothetical protein